MIPAEEQLDMNRHINTAREEGGDTEKEGRKQKRQGKNKEHDMEEGGCR